MFESMFIYNFFGLLKFSKILVCKTLYASDVLHENRKWTDTKNNTT